MTGAKKFADQRFEILDVKRGRSTWSSFENMMKQEKYVKSTKFTINIA